MPNAEVNACDCLVPLIRYPSGNEPEGLTLGWNMSDQEEPVGLVPQRSDALILSFKKWGEAHQTTRTLLRCMLAGGLGYLALEAIRSLAGHDTSVIVKLGLMFLADIKVVVALGLTGSATVWALVERHARRKTIKRFAPYVRAHELSLDPGRTSSYLTEHGKTNPKDINR